MGTLYGVHRVNVSQWLGNCWQFSSLQTVTSDVKRGQITEAEATNTRPGPICGNKAEAERNLSIDWAWFYVCTNTI